MVSRAFWYGLIFMMVLLGGAALLAFCLAHWLYPTLIIVLGAFLVTMVYIVSTWQPPKYN